MEKKLGPFLDKIFFTLSLCKRNASLFLQNVFGHDIHHISASFTIYGIKCLLVYFEFDEMNNTEFTFWMYEVLDLNPEQVVKPWPFYAFSPKDNWYCYYPTERRRGLMSEFEELVFIRLYNHIGIKDISEMEEQDRNFN